ncbi:MAG: cobalamin B12-binding domain-containing protein [Pseudomonadota bacterium]
MAGQSEATFKDEALQPERHQSSEVSLRRHAYPTQQELRSQPDLARTIEGEIIPRLMLAHRNGRRAVHGTSAQHGTLAQAMTGDALDVESFVAKLSMDEGHEAAGYVESLVQKGFDPQALILELLAPSAQRLGDMWCKDTCDFVTVTIALGRLQLALNALSAFGSQPLTPPKFDANGARNADEASMPKHILLCGAPGDDHTFGLSVVGDILERHGWAVTLRPHVESNQEIRDLARAFGVAVVGLTLSCTRFLKPLIACVDQLHSSLERRPRVLVGGQAFISNPEYLSAVRYDAFARDAVEAVKVADQLFEDVKLERLRVAADCC